MGWILNKTNVIGIIHEIFAGCEAALALMNYQAGVAGFRPILPARLSARLINRPAFAGSPNKTIPSIAVPTEPTPTKAA